jgi:hypothetical protein
MRAKAIPEQQMHDWCMAPDHMADPHPRRDDYHLLKEVLDTLVSSRSPSAEIEQSAQRLTERGYLYADEQGNLRLTEEGKMLLRRKS